MERRNAEKEAKRSFAQSSFAYFSFKKSRSAEHCAAVLLQGLQDGFHVGVRLFGGEAAVVGPSSAVRLRSSARRVRLKATDFLPSGILAPR